MSKKILVISPFFYPEPISTAKYNTSLTKELVKKGAEVSVICLHRFYPEWVIKPSNEKIDGVTIKRGGRFLVFPKSQIFRRLILELGFAWHVLINMPSKLKQYDQVIGILPPSLFLFALIYVLPKSLYKTAIVHDLQSVYAKETKGILGKLIGRITAYIEGTVIKAMDKTVYLSDSMKLRAESEFKVSGLKSIIAYPFINITPEKTLGRKLEDLIHEDYENIVYSGALSDKQNPNKLLSLMELVVSGRESTKGYIFSSGPVFEKLKSENRNKKIHFYSLVEESCLAELYSRSTIQLIPQLEGSSEASLPSKLPNLLYSGCPIFVITDSGSELGNVVEHYSHTVVVYSWAIDQLASKINVFLDNLKGVERKEIIHERHNNEHIRKFDLEYLCDQILLK